SSWSFYGGRPARGSPPYHIVLTRLSSDPTAPPQSVRERRAFVTSRRKATATATAQFLGRHDLILCADSRHVWRGVVGSRKAWRDSNGLDGKIRVGMRLD